MEVVYLPMPVSYEEKRDWNKKGFKVVDAVFAPDGYEPPVDGEDATKKQKPKG